MATKYKRPKEQKALRSVLYSLKKNEGVDSVMFGSDNMGSRTNDTVKTTYYAFYMPTFAQLCQDFAKPKVISFNYGNLVLIDIRTLQRYFVSTSTTCFLMLSDEETVTLLTRDTTSIFLKEQEKLQNNLIVGLCEVIKRLKIEESDSLSHYAYNFTTLVIASIYYKIAYNVLENKKSLKEAINTVSLSSKQVKEMQLMSKETAENKLKSIQKLTLSLTSREIPTEKEISVDFQKQLGKFIVLSLTNRRIL